MSTNYYFVNKEDLQTLKKFNKFIKQLDNLIDKKSDKFLENIDDIKIEDILYDFKKDYKKDLIDAYKPEELHICKTSGGIITFQANDNYGNFDELEKFYKDNKNNYIIQDEYGTKYTWNSLLKKIGYNRKLNYKWIKYYFS